MNVHKTKKLRFTALAAGLAALAMVSAPVAASAGGKSKPSAKAAKAAAAKRPENPAPAATNVAATEPTDQIMLANDNVVAVQPVFMVGAGAEGGWYDMAAYVAGAKADKAAGAEVAKAAISAPKAIDKGFGFAGAASAKDVRVLHQGVALGFIPALLIAGDQAKAKSLATGLMGSMDSLADLTEDAQKSAKLFIALGLRDKKMDGELLGMVFATAMRAGMSGIAAGPQRPHGYYVAGIWAGNALLFATLGGKNDTFADMAEPICVLLDKDAAFGGSDRTIASHMRTIAAELRKEKPSAATVRGEVEAILSVKPD
jgi:hypothetical protein